MRLLNFQDFNKLQDLNSIYESTREEVMSLLEAEETLMDAGIFAINEAFSSSILRNLIDSDPEAQSKYSKKFWADMYKKYGVAVSDITDEDFTILNSYDEFAKQDPYKKNTDYIGFLINDNPEVIKKGSWNKSIQRAGEILLCIMSGSGTNFFYGFNEAPSGSFRSKQGPNDRYGILYDQYQKSTYFGANYKAPATTLKFISEVTTKVYVLNMESLKEKYNAKVKQSERKSAKEGALALKDVKQIRQENLTRYKKIIAEGVGPQNVLDLFKTCFSKMSDGLSEWISSIKLDDIEGIKDKRVGEFQIDGWNTSGTRILDKLWDRFGNYMYDYLTYVSKVQRIDRYTEALETGIYHDIYDDKKIELTPERRASFEQYIPIYQDELKDANVKFVDHIKTFKTMEKDIDTAVAGFKNLIK
jgi:hypothetical protein